MPGTKAVSKVPRGRVGKVSRLAWSVVSILLAIWALPSIPSEAHPWRHWVKHVSNDWLTVAIGVIVVTLLVLINLDELKRRYHQWWPATDPETLETGQAAQKVPGTARSALDYSRTVVSRDNAPRTTYVLPLPPEGQRVSASAWGPANPGDPDVILYEVVSSEPASADVQFQFLFHSLKMDLDSNVDDEERSVQFWFHFENSADVTLAYRMVGGYVRVGNVLSETDCISDRYLVAPRSPSDYGWFWMQGVTKEALKDVEVHLVVHYGRPQCGPWFAMDCLIQPQQSAYFPDGWPSNWVWRQKREVIHKPLDDTASSRPLPPTGVTPVFVATITEGRSYATMGKPTFPGFPPLVTLHARFWGHVAPSSDPVTLLSARLDPVVDGSPQDRLVSPVSQYIEKGTLPDDYAYPPVVQPGQTVELEATFHFQAHRLGDTLPEFPESSFMRGQYVQPRSVRGQLTVIDQLKRPHDAGEVDFRGPWYVS